MNIRWRSRLILAVTLAGLCFRGSILSAVSGVNLDEEAAKLLQFQQSYQAAAKMLQISQSIFDTLLQGMGR